jgi:hypothetical protein
MIHNHWLSITHKSWCVMLRQWLWIMVCYSEPVVVNHGVLYGAIGCESWCVILSQWLLVMMCIAEPVSVNHGLFCWLRIIHHYSQTLAQNNTPWFTTTVSALHTMTHNHSDQYSTAWFTTTCYTEPVVVNHGVLCGASGCESWCFIRSHWLWIMVCYTEPVVVSHDVYCWASGCESWFVLLCQWLWHNHWLGIINYDSQPLCSA